MSYARALPVSQYYGEAQMGHKQATVFDFSSNKLVTSPHASLLSGAMEMHKARAMADARQGVEQRVCAASNPKYVCSNNSECAGAGSKCPTCMKGKCQ